jgi:hypothetical protein
MAPMSAMDRERSSGQGRPRGSDVAFVIPKIDTVDPIVPVTIKRIS